MFCTDGEKADTIMPIEKVFHSSAKVWGCGGLNAKAAQEKQKQWEKKQVQKSKDRKVRIDVHFLACSHVSPLHRQKHSLLNICSSMVNILVWTIMQ